MDKLGACRRCGSVVTIGSSCKCEEESADQMMSIQDRREQPSHPRRRRRRPAQPTPAQRGRRPARGPTRQPGDPDSDRKTANKVIIGGFLLLLAVVAVCSWRIGGSSENRSAQAEVDNIAAYQRMNIDLRDCYRWLVQYDDSRQVYASHGYADGTAERMAIEDNKRGYTFGEYRAILQRCGVLWGEATEQEKLRAMRQP